MSKMGRPPVEKPKQNKVTIRMTDENYKRLMEYNQKHNQSLTETMSEAFELLMKKKG